MQSYEGRPRRGKIDLMGDLVDAADGLEADFQLLRISRQWSLEDYVAGADATVDARHGHPAEWRGACGAPPPRPRGPAGAPPHGDPAGGPAPPARGAGGRLPGGGR